MNSRDKILETVNKELSNPNGVISPASVCGRRFARGPHFATFTTTLDAIGGAVFIVAGFDAIAAIVHASAIPKPVCIIGGLPELAGW